MNKKEFIEVYNQVLFTSKWHFMNGKSDSIKSLEKKYKTRFLSRDELIHAINKLKEFDINLLWDESFWGLKVHESISAIAVEPYTFVKKIKEDKFELGGI